MLVYSEGGFGAIETQVGGAQQLLMAFGIEFSSQKVIHVIQQLNFWFVII